MSQKRAVRLELAQPAHTSLPVGLLLLLLRQWQALRSFSLSLRLGRLLSLLALLFCFVTWLIDFLMLVGNAVDYQSTAFLLDEGMSESTFCVLLGFYSLKAKRPVVSIVSRQCQCLSDL